MDEGKNLSAQWDDAHDAREVVEYYCPRQTREVILYYVGGYRVQHKIEHRQGAVALPKKRSRKGLWIALGFFVLLLLTVAIALFFQQSMAPSEDYDGPFHTYDYTKGDGKVYIPTHPLGGDMDLEIVTKRGRELTAQEVYAAVNPSVVTVMVQVDGGMSVGTGVILSADGYVLTNFHVLEDGSGCSVALSTGQIYEAKYVAGDKDNDIAVIKVETENLQAAEIGDSDALAVGDKVYAIGNPLGLELRGTFTDGIVSAIDRSVEVEGREMTLVQTNAALNNGNSGGPLINASGQVVGINTIKMSSSYSTIEGLGFALPTSVIFRQVNDLVSTGTIQPETSLGITVSALSQMLPDGEEKGLLVMDVTPGSGADLAGILPGDAIVSANGEPTHMSTDLLRVRRTLHAGDVITLEILRNGERMEFSVELQEAS